MLHSALTPEERFSLWLDSLDEGWWDDAGDAGTILNSLQDAWEAGWGAGYDQGCLDS